MTAQRREILLYKGQRQGMAAEPLNNYLATRPGIELGVFSTACWRGYYGIWEVKEDKLFLVELKALLKSSGEKVGIDYFFPDQTQVFADWFSGAIRVPQGELLKYEHQGYASIYEKDLYLTFEKGILVSSHEEANADRTPEYSPKYLTENITLDWKPSTGTISSFTSEEDRQGLAALEKEGESIKEYCGLKPD